MSELDVGSILLDSVQPKPTRRPARAHRHDDAAIASEVRRLTRGRWRNAPIRPVAGVAKHTKSAISSVASREPLQG